MKITPIKSQYEKKDNRVQLMYSTSARWLLLDKDEKLLPVGTSKNSIQISGYYVALSSFDKIQYRLLTTIHGYTGSFVAFTKHNDKIFMIEMFENDFKSKKTKIKCTLEEKDKILNGFKKPSTIILHEDGSHIYYANFPFMQEVKDEFNLLSEDEILEREESSQKQMNGLLSRLCEIEFESDVKIDPNNVDISLYGQRGLNCHHDYAIEFVSDSKVRCTGFDVKMKGKNNYEVLLDAFEIDFAKVKEELISHRDLTWFEKDCLSDPDPKTLKDIDKKIKQI